jgi:hypothetical protein
LNEIENKEVHKVYILFLDCDGPLLLQDPSSFQFTQNSKPSDNYKLPTPLLSTNNNFNNKHNKNKNKSVPLVIWQHDKAKIMESVW